jgi:D-alanine-D-alanine ligase
MSKKQVIAILFSHLEKNKENYYRDVESVYNVLNHIGHKVCKVSVDSDIKKVLLTIKKHSPEYIFNLCEEVAGNSWGEMYIAGVLELLNIPYTGSGPFSFGLCLDKAKNKDILANNGINVPKYYVFSTDTKIPINIKFPLIVKPLHEDGSYGIEAESIVWNNNALLKRIAIISKKFKQPAIAEQYIAGRELNVSILGNGRSLKVLPISEIDYSKMPEDLPKICTYNAKWAENTDEYINSIPVCPANLSRKVKNSIEDAAVQAYNTMQCRDYARVDIRLDKNKIPYIIDINPNPCLSPDSGFVRSASVAGFTYEQLIEEILERCKKRYAKYNNN